MAVRGMRCMHDPHRGRHSLRTCSIFPRKARSRRQILAPGPRGGAHRGHGCDRRSACDVLILAPLRLPLRRRGTCGLCQRRRSRDIGAQPEARRPRGDPAARPAGVQGRLRCLRPRLRSGHLRLADHLDPRRVTWSQHQPPRSFALPGPHIVGPGRLSFNHAPQPQPDSPQAWQPACLVSAHAAREPEKPACRSRSLPPEPPLHCRESSPKERA